MATVTAKSLTGTEKLEQPPLRSDRGQKKSNPALLALCALGVVFGDIGTSPLYALQTVFTADNERVQTNPVEVYGVISLVIAVYSLIGVNLGGFFVGMLLGAVGGILTVAWMPKKAVPAEPRPLAARR